jgi:hypothetical protein
VAIIDLSRYRKRRPEPKPCSYARVDWKEEEDEIAKRYREYGLTDRGVPWWAVALLPLQPGSDEYKCRRVHQYGRITKPLHNGERVRTSDYGHGTEFVELWRHIVELAVDEWGGASPRDAIREDDVACRKAALTDPRAFVQFIGLLDDDLQPWNLKSFHVQAVRAMRGKYLACILLPFAHGKSALSSLVVPLMDWAENPESTQLRVYHSGNHTKYWTRKLMAEVENNDQLHALFPWIARPRKGDPCEGIWSTDGFSIQGKKVVDPSFRPLTAGSSIVGVRADRVGADDWVNEFNGQSLTVQEKFYNYFKTGVLTMRRKRMDWRSPYETRWGTAYLIGTIFDRRDVNFRIYKEWSEELQKERKQRAERKLLLGKTPDRSQTQYSVLRFSIYPNNDSRARKEVLWPEYRPYEYVQQLEIDLGRRAFMMRCENKPLDTEEQVFTQSMLDDACREDLVYGELPDRRAGDTPLRYLIAYDPATGTKTGSRYQKYPAAVLMGQNPETEELHFIRYERWAIPQPRQIDRLVDWARRYGCAVCVESNNIQASYQDWLREKAPDVRVITHYTSNVKHDAGAGVESLLPLFEAGKVRIHTGSVEPVTLREFVTEFVEWPQGRYTDMLMASWIGRYNLRTILRGIPHNGQVLAPDYVQGRGFRQTVNLSRYR